MLPRVVRRCSRAQLRVASFGRSGAAGTGLLGIAIANVASTPCWLQGTPGVTFFRRAATSTLRLAVDLNHSGPAFFFAPRPPRVVLFQEQAVHSAIRPRLPAVSAGLVLTSRDFPSGTNPWPCQPIAAVSLRLPGVSGTYIVRFDSGSYRICDVPPPVAVSPIVTARVLADVIEVGPNSLPSVTIAPS